MVNAMNKVLKDCIPDVTMPFLDDILIKDVRIRRRMNQKIRMDVESSS